MDFSCNLRVDVRMAYDEVDRGRNDDGCRICAGNDMLYGLCNNGGVADGVGVLTLSVDEVLLP